MWPSTVSVSRIERPRAVGGGAGFFGWSGPPMAQPVAQNLPIRSMTWGLVQYLVRLPVRLCMIEPSEITALILAGGRGRRMGGRDKGLLPWHGRPLVEHVAASIRPQVGALLISANRNEAAYGRLGLPVLADPIADYQGPLAGFLAGLQAMQTDYLLTLPCDGPVVIPDLARRLANGVAREGAEIGVAFDGRRLQPVYTLLHRAVLPGLRAALDEGERKIDRWFPRHHWTRVDFADVPQLFDNINTPEDLAEASRQVTNRHSIGG
jgi:molybdenum cofactor guanylyltransferase